jgi:hypothetical protein
LKNLAVPAFSPRNSLHVELVRQSRVCQAATVGNETSKLRQAEDRIDELASTMWELDAKTLTRINAYLPSITLENDDTDES